MRTSFVTIFLISALNICRGQDSIAVIRQYYSDSVKTKADSFFYKIQNTIFISLWEGFDDSLCITVNDKILVKQHFKTDKSLGLAGQFQVSFENQTDVKVLKLNFAKANLYIEEKLNLAYKSLQIRRDYRWLLIYTNHFPILE